MSSRREVRDFPLVQTIVDAGSTLSSETLGELERAYSASTPKPLLIQRQLSRDTYKSLYSEWHEHITSNNQSTHDTFEHGPQTLTSIWDDPQGIRMETPKGKAPNPVRDWLEGAPLGSVTASLAQVQAQLDAFVSRTCPPACELVYPAFVAGRITHLCGPTHYDSYDNFALVLVGHKTFYVAPYDMFKDKPLAGPNESYRAGVNPFNHSLSTDHEDLTRADNWEKAHLLPGDILFLPRTYWHCVYSRPHTVMTNTWVHP